MPISIQPIWRPRFFSPSEFACRCSYDDCDRLPKHLLDDIEALAHELEIGIRIALDRPVDINSGYRCPRHNANTPGASKNSLHTAGRAADVSVTGLSGDFLAGFVEAQILNGLMSEGELGTYSNRIHKGLGGPRRRFRG